MTGSRRDQLAAFYGERAAGLRAIVAGQVRTGDHTVVEDACQHAWSVLARRDDVVLDDRGAAWLARVAIREGWRLARPGRAVPFGEFRGDGDHPGLECAEPASLDGDPESLLLAREEHDRRVVMLAQLSALQRRDLYLHAAGFTYSEIAVRTGSPASAVNRHLCRGRAHLGGFRAA